MKQLLTTIILLIAIIPLFAVNIYVSPKGNDKHDGTKDSPLQTIMMAQRKARELRRLNAPEIQEGINIIVADGTYFLDEPLLFRPEDSGSETSLTTIKGENGALPRISGGVKVNGWKKTGKVSGFEKAGRNLWVADMPRKAGRSVEFRQMWVDGVKANRASNLDDGELDRILAADHENEVFWIPLPDVNLSETRQLEMVIHQWWAIANLRVKDIEIVGDSAKISLFQPECRIEFEHPWPAPFIDSEKKYNGNSAFYFVNHPALLNNPGEWYADTDNGKIYYWPREGENMDRAEVLVPFLETLVSIEGTLDHPVEYIHFENLSFEHTTWMRPSERGHVPLQAGFYLLDAYKLKEPGTPDKAGLENQAWLGRQPAAIELRNAQHNRIFKCKVMHAAATGIDLVTGTAYNEIVACKIEDIGGTGIQAGFFGDAAFEAHLPYNPGDEREVCRFETISNNLISNVTNEDWGCVGISVGFAHDINIEYNEVSHLNYSGICVGWGWTKTINCMKNNRVHANYIHHFARNMYDVGGIYTLSAQPNGEISENRIEKLLKAPYAHIPDHYQYIYYDEGSSYIRAVNNWTEKDKFFSNTPGPGNEWINNGPDVDEAIKNKAGIQAAYRW
jgi:hypothetical protein